MSKKQRERKAVRVEQELIEKIAIEQRRKVRVAPMFRTAKKLTFVVVTTVFVLYLGVMINNRLPEILTRIAENG